MNDSIHKKLERVRKPRVHIKYDIETEGNVVEKELPFVMGVMGDFTGNPTTPKKSLSERKFIQIDRDNINDVMKKMAPGLNLKVKNTLADDGSLMSVEPLKKLLDTRNKLRDLLTKSDRSEELESLLENVLQSTDEVSKLADELKDKEGKGNEHE